MTDSMTIVTGWTRQGSESEYHSAVGTGGVNTRYLLQKTLYLVFFPLLLLISCATPEYLSADDLQAFIQDEGNGLSRSRDLGALSIRMSYRPTDFLIAQELGDETDQDKAKAAFDKYEDYSYFMLQLSRENKDALYNSGADQHQFSENLQTLSFRMSQYIQMTTSQGDTLGVADTYYARMFGMSASTDVLIVFEKDKMQAADWVTIHLKEFGFKTGNQSFRFECRKLWNTPRLEALKTVIKENQSLPTE